MSDVEFDSDLQARQTTSGGYQRYPPPQRASTGMAGWLMSKGIARSANVANIILAAVVIGALAVTYSMLRGSISSARKPAPLEYLYHVYGRP